MTVARKRRSRITRRRWFLRPLLMIGVVCLLLSGGWFVFGDSGLWEMRMLRQQKQQQSEQIRRLEARKHELANYLEALNARDEKALERAARERGMVAAHETIYTLHVEPDPPK